jgi:hypothetical protein
MVAGQPAGWRFRKTLIAAAGENLCFYNMLFNYCIFFAVKQ